MKGFMFVGSAHREVTLALLSHLGTNFWLELECGRTCEWHVYYYVHAYDGWACSSQQVHELDKKFRSSKESFWFEVWACHKGQRHWVTRQQVALVYPGQLSTYSFSMSVVCRSFRCGNSRLVCRILDETYALSLIPWRTP